MNKTLTQRVLSVILCTVLIAAMALFTFGCDDKQSGGDTSATTTTAEIEAPATGGAATTEASTTDAVATDGTTDPAETESTPDPSAPTVKGEGETVFYFNVIDKDGNETKFEIHTDKETVGDALLELGLIEGEDGPYGLYVKKVNGILADYDVDQTYWALLINGDYALTGVDTTKITAGATYTLKVSK